MRYKEITNSKRVFEEDPVSQKDQQIQDKLDKMTPAQQASYYAKGKNLPSNYEPLTVSKSEIKTDIPSTMSNVDPKLAKQVDKQVSKTVDKYTDKSGNVDLNRLLAAGVNQLTPAYAQGTRQINKMLYRDMPKNAQAAKSQDPQGYQKTYDAGDDATKAQLDTWQKTSPKQAKADYEKQQGEITKSLSDMGYNQYGYTKGEHPFKTAGAWIKDKINEDEENKKSALASEVQQFAHWAKKHLHIENMPKITLSMNTKEAQNGRHTGRHVQGDSSLWVYAKNRNLVDILRTVFHELVHWRQTELDMIKPGDSYPGSPIEAQADMLAGKFIKIYGKKHPHIFQ